MSFDSFLSDVLATVVGGLALAAIIFGLRETLFAAKDVTGRWYFELTTEETSYKPFVGMRLRYVAILGLDSNRIFGTAEKVFESSSTGDREYVGANRARARVEGSLQHNYFRPDRVFLHITEVGPTRESTNSHALEVQGDGRMSGTFCSMVADQEGSVSWNRES